MVQAIYPLSIRTAFLRAYLILLRVEFTMPQAVTCCAVCSYHTLSPLPVPIKAIGGLLSVALVVSSRFPGVTWHSVLWSPDFPPHNELIHYAAITVLTPSCIIPFHREKSTSITNSNPTHRAFSYSTHKFERSMLQLF
jgi:hypothetical protein